MIDLQHLGCLKTAVPLVDSVVADLTEYQDVCLDESIEGAGIYANQYATAASLSSYGKTFIR